MKSKAFTELKYLAWENFLYDGEIFPSKTKRSIVFNWEKKLPVGRSKFEHYNKGCKMLSDLIKANTVQPETTVLIIGSAFTPILYFADNFERSDVTIMNGAYEVGSLDGVCVVVEPTFTENEKLLIDLAKKEVIAVDTGVYDYESDLAELMKENEKENNK